MGGCLELGPKIALTAKFRDGQCEWGPDATLAELKVPHKSSSPPCDMESIDANVNPRRRRTTGAYAWKQTMKVL